MLRVLAQTASLLAATSPPVPLVADPVALAPPPVRDVAERVVGHAFDDEPERGGRRPFRLQRAALELGVAMALGVGWYESQIELNKLDFDFDRTLTDQRRRLLSADGYRFDDNSLTLNVGHAFMGAYYHQFARANGGGMLEALLFDLTTSTVWELAVEHREVFSLNDTVATGLGGVAVGESLYQLGDFLARSEPSLRNRVLMGLVSPAHAAGLLFGDRPRPSAMGYDARGLARDASHRFALELGAAHGLAGVGGREGHGEGYGAEAGPSGSGPGWTGELRVALDLVNLPSYGRAARRRRWLGGGELTRIDVEYRGSRQDLQALSIQTRATLWGRWLQDTRAGDAGGLRGHGSFVGSATAFELAVEQMGRFDDFLTAMHLPGPAADVTLHRDRLALRLSTDVTPDFALVRPFALDPALTPAELAGAKSTLGAYRYYYAMGVAAATRVEASYRKARAGAAVAFSHHDSIEGLDRHQNAYVSPTGVSHAAISDDADAVDQRLKLRLYGDSALPLTDLRVGASLDYRQRTGSYGDTERTREDLRVSLLASYAL